MADVFIAYKREDLDRVRPLVRALEGAKLSVWWDQMLSPVSWVSQTEQELDKARVVIAVWSNAATVNKRDVFRAEAFFAMERGNLIPVLIDQVKLPFPFQLIQAYDLVGWDKSRTHPQFRQLRKAIRDLATVGSGEPDRPPLPPPSPPPGKDIGPFPNWLPAAGLAVAALIIGVLIGQLLRTSTADGGGIFPPPGSTTAAAGSEAREASATGPVVAGTSAGASGPGHGGSPAGVAGATSSTAAAAQTALIESCAHELEKAAGPGPVKTAPPTLDGPMAIAGGPVSLTYFQMAKDLVKLSEPYGLTLQPMVTNGTLDNIIRLAGRGNAGVGFAQSDVDLYLQHAGNPILRNSVGKLRLIASLHNEEVHVLTRQSIKGLADLKGKRVVVANDSEGSLVTATNLFRLTKIEPGEIDKSLKPYVAVCNVIHGAADAMFITTGRPAPLLTAIAQLSPPHDGKVHLMPIANQLPGVYEVTTIPKGAYSWQTEEVRTVSVQALLIAYDFSSGDGTYIPKRCGDVAALGRILRDNIQTLQKGSDFHEKWKQVNPRHLVVGWEQDRCSAPPALPAPPKPPKPAPRPASS